MFDVAWSDGWTLVAAGLAIVLVTGLGYAGFRKKSRPDDGSGTAGADSARWHWPRWGAWRH